MLNSCPVSTGNQNRLSGRAARALTHEPSLQSPKPVFVLFCFFHFNVGTRNSNSYPHVWAASILTHWNIFLWHPPLPSLAERDLEFGCIRGELRACKQNRPALPHTQTPTFFMGSSMQDRSENKGSLLFFSKSWSLVIWHRIKTTSSFTGNKKDSAV